MKTIISFKNVDGIEILKFTNLNKMYDNDYKRVVFDLFVKFDFFKAETTLDGEEFDFIDMRERLEKLLVGRWKSFVFNPIGEQFQMQFDLMESGQIRIRSKLSNPIFTGRFEFEYFTEQTFIHSLIEELEIAMKENSL